MKITLAKSAGFCLGVKRAVDIALKTACGDKKVYMLGDIVHNEDVVREIEKTGIKKIKRLSRGRTKTLLIRAHGIDNKTLRRAMLLGYKIVDATCPMVKEIHKIVQDMEQKGYKIIVIGDKLHDEVHGIIGQLNHKAIVIDPTKAIPLKAIKQIKKACIVVQSTQDLERILKTVRVLRDYIKELKFFNTICRPTRIKQEEIRTIPRENDVMIIIGSRKSANTKRLYEIAKSLNPKSYWVGSKKDINPRWFKRVRKVGITAGASTPESTIQEIIRHISNLGTVLKPR